MIFKAVKSILMGFVFISFCTSLAQAQEDAFSPGRQPAESENPNKPSAGYVEASASCEPGPKVSIPGANPAMCENHVQRGNLAQVKVNQGAAIAGSSSSTTSPAPASTQDR